MKEIRGLMEKDLRLFFRQGSNLFLVLAFIALFFILTGKTGATFIATYIPSVMAVYSGNTISYDENEHGYTYLFTLPVNKKMYVREKYLFSFIMTVCGWGIGVICAGIAVLIKPGEVFDLEMLAMELITIFVFQVLAGIVIAIRLRVEGEKGHIHYMIETEPTMSISKIVNLMKSYTTYHIWKRYPQYLRKQFWKEHTFWTDGYFACSVGNVSEEMLKRYIGNQG